jgi:hypothetical protein
MSMRCFFAALLLLMLAVPTWGQDNEKGMQAFEQGDYATAFKVLTRLLVERTAGNGFKCLKRTLDARRLR